MSLLLHYKFDNTGVTLDSSGNSRHLINIGGVSTTSDSTHGSVAYFQGTNYLYLPEADTRPTGSPRTVSVWLNRSKEGSMTLFDLGGIKEERFIMYFLTGVMKVRASFTNSTESDQPINTWYHLAITFDGSTINVYQNGELIHSASGKPDATETPIGPLHIGRLSNYAGYYFQGRMSDFRLYDYALHPTEMSTLFSNGPGEPQIPETIAIQGKTSTTISCLVEGDPNSTYRVEVGSVIVDDVKAGEIVDVVNLKNNTAYTCHLYKS